MRCIPKTEDSIDLVVECIKKGGIAILPTDTVYGFSGLVDTAESYEECKKQFNTDACIRSIKGRSEEKPLIELIASPDDLKKYTDDFIPPEILSKWPGALTVIVNVKKDSPLLGVNGTVAFRCPGDLWLRNVINKVGSPLYSTSVNRSGKPVLENMDDIRKEFSNEVDIFIEDGNKNGCVPSTIVKIENGVVKVLRQGAVIV